MRRVLAIMAIVFSLVAGGVGGSTLKAEPADAATNGIYVVAPKWAGWCPDIRKIKNKVTGMSATNRTTGDSRSDLGDDIIWVAAKLNANNTIDVGVGCSLGHGSAGTTVTVKPTKNNQTVFVWPGGGIWLK